ncbi:hypothetical protein [Paenibacillus arenilitoris]|uniref:DUF2269 family protein n=1 Tax=Paenibacillus arenilitoris TaxID=2772299 RepID=A0A927CMC3_9BACL|nr:hypothetical protein [Paenibacillus arenilitoris]MBD2868240.1 hypothetical protein [Paenibacillus arenilitoris]
MKRLALTPKKWLLALHLLFAGIMLGVTVVFLVLSIAAANTDSGDILKACYNGMHILAESSVRASTIGTVVTGILLSVLTHWGLFKYYWLIAKELLTVLSIGLGVVGMYEWSLKAVTIVTAEGLGAWQNPTFAVNNGQLVTGIVLQIASLAAMFVLSVFKPWGPRKARSVAN